MLAPSVQHSYALGMRKYLDIPLTVAVTTALTIAMRWPLEAPPPAPEGRRQAGTLHGLRGSRLPGWPALDA